MTRMLLPLAAALLIAVPSVQAQEAVFVIRHAEKAGSGDDPDLTAAGRARATAWAAMLAPSEIDHVVTSNARRTRETGRIVAETLGVDRSELAIGDVTGLLDLLSFDFADQRVLVVGHTETIPSIITGMGHTGKVQIALTDYANLFVIRPSEDSEPVLIQLQMP